MNRKKYKRFGAVLMIVAVIQYIIFGCIVSTLTGSAWLENVSIILLCVLLSAGTVMLINARSEKNFKKVLIEEKDERNKLINLSACGVTLFVALICYVGVFVYMKSAGLISGMQTVIFAMPVLIGALVYGLSTLYYQKHI